MALAQTLNLNPKITNKKFYLLNLNKFSKISLKSLSFGDFNDVNFIVGRKVVTLGIWDRKNGRKSGKS